MTPVHEKLPDDRKAHTHKVIINGKNITDWSRAGDLPYATIAWQGASGVGARVVVYKYRWKNPLPDFEIESIDFVGNSKCSLGLIAITLEE